MPSSDPRLRSYRWKQLSKQILSVNDLCHICGERGADTVDHLIARADGGDMWDPANLAPAHRTCNSRKGAGKKHRSETPTSRNW